MNKTNIIKTTAVLTMMTIALTLTIAANAGIAADSAPVAAPDDMTTCDVQLALPSGGE